LDTSLAIIAEMRRQMRAAERYGNATQCRRLNFWESGRHTCHSATLLSGAGKASLASGGRTVTKRVFGLQTAT
jgi:hypothetical protein